MRSSKLRAGLDKLSPQKAEDTLSAPQAASALASALDLNEGNNRLAEAREIALAQIHPNPDQPRKTFLDSSLEALAASIREQGVLQPITVTPDGAGYRIVAGERRWRASQLAGLERNPALVRNLSARDQRIVALMENLQREDLNDIDRARGLADLRETLATASPGLTSHELDDEVGKRLGISGRSVRNFLALLQLAEPVQSAIAVGDLTEKHGRAIRRLPEAELQSRVAEVAAQHKLTGDETGLFVMAIRELTDTPIIRLAEMIKSGELQAKMKAVEEEMASPSPGAPTPAPMQSPLPENPTLKPKSAASAALEGSLNQLEEGVRKLETLLQSEQAHASHRPRLEALAARLLQLTRTLDATPSDLV